METNHGTFRDLALGWEEATARLPKALADEGFGVVTTIDLKQTFAAKLGVEHRRYTIFGACNPRFAHDAIQRDPTIGVLLPCNVVLYEKDDGKVVLGAIDPMQSLGRGAPEPMAEVAREVGARLGRVIDAMSGAR